MMFFEAKENFEVFYAIYKLEKLFQKPKYKERPLLKPPRKDFQKAQHTIEFGSEWKDTTSPVRYECTIVKVFIIAT